MWAELLVTSGYGKPEFVGAVLIAGLVVGFLAILRAWYIDDPASSHSAPAAPLGSSPADDVRG